MKKNDKKIPLGFYKKSFLTYLLITLTAFVLIALLFVYVVFMSWNKEVAYQIEITDKSAKQLESYLENADKIALQVVGNENISRIFTDIPIAEGNYFENNVLLKEEVEKALRSINGPNMSVGRISIYSPYEDYVSYGYFYENPAAIKEKLISLNASEIIESIDSQEQKKHIFSVHKDDWSNSGETLISVYRTLKNVTLHKNIAIVEVQVKLSDLENLLLPSYSDKTIISIFDNTGNLINTSLDQAYTNVLLKNTQQINNLEKTKYVSSANVYHRDSSLLVYSTTEKYNWSIITYQSTKNIFSGILNSIAYIGIVILIAFILLALVLYITTLRLSKPMVELQNRLKNVTISNLSVNLENKEHLNEVERLNNAFSLMFTRLDQSIKNEMNANYKALQAQMSPHFLHNVISVISTAASENNSKHIPELCSRLSAMLRYTSSYQSQEASLLEELKHAEDYLCLMKARHEHRIEYNLEIIGDISNIMLPKLTVQPIIDNCFKHAFNNTNTPWNINVCGYGSDDYWSITVRDNGVGLSQDKIAELLAPHDLEVEENIINGSQIGGLGLRNTIMRHKLLYGNKIKFDIKNLPSGGLEIIIFGERSYDFEKD